MKNILFTIVMTLAAVLLLVLFIVAYADRAEKYKSMSYLGYVIKVLIWEQNL